jgi:DNA-binding beta-propeller fold protein YncE
MGHVGLYDARSGARLGIGTLGRNPRSIAITADGRYLGAANFSSSDVSLVDMVERTHRTHPVPGASRIVGLAMHPSSSPVRLYATSWDTNELILLMAR